MADQYYSAADVHVAWGWDPERRKWIAHGRVGGVLPVERVEAFAAAPADRRSSFTGGFALPYAGPVVALLRTATGVLPEQ